MEQRGKETQPPTLHRKSSTSPLYFSPLSLVMFGLIEEALFSLARGLWKYLMLKKIQKGQWTCSASQSPAIETYCLLQRELLVLWFIDSS